MMPIISFLILLYTLYEARKIYTNFWMMPATVFSTILFLSQLEYYYLYTFPVSDYVKIGKFDFNYNIKVYIFHQILMIVCLLSIRNTRVNKVEKMFIKQWDFSLEFPKLQKSTSVLPIYIIFYLIMLLLILKHFSELPIELFLENNTYHLLKDAEALGLDNISRIIHFLAGILAIFIGVLAIILYRNKFKAFAVLLIPFFLYFLSLKVAATSRWGPLIVFALVPFLYKPKSLKSSLSMFLTAFASLGLYLGALFGRRALNGQGILAIFKNVSLGFDSIEYYLPKILATSLSSSWNFSLALQVFDNTNVSFDQKYKILAFSPLTSSLDGYDNLVADNIIKIHSYAPVNFISELYFFGPVYIIFAFLFLYFILKKANSFFIKYGIVAVLPCATLYLFFFKMQQYPIRNSFRFIVIALLAMYIFERIKKKQRQSN